MLRKQSRPVTSKQAAMADCASPRENYRRPSSAFSNSPTLFTAFSSKGSSTDSELLMSPTSILDSNKPFSVSPRTPLRPESNKFHWEKLDSRGVGLGILDALKEEKSESKLLKSDNPKVLFSSQLKVQIPLVLSANFHSDSPRSPADFGTKTKNCQMGCSSSPSCVKKSDSPMVFPGLSIDEMELSEDYTCVVSHGPIPRTTHIFDDCVIESCRGSVGVPSKRSGKESLINHSMSYPSETFLSFCHSCKKNLGQGNDIYIYRGDRAFCSSECRDKIMIMEEGNEGLEL